MNYPWRLYVAVKLYFISLTTRLAGEGGGRVPVNKKGAACNILKGAD